MASQLSSRRVCPSRITFSLLILGCLSACLFSDGHPLQSNCNQAHFEFDRILNDGTKCSNFSYSDCGSSGRASECINYCAHDTCQSTECSTDEDCAIFGTAVCEDYIVSDVNYGKWCNFTESYGGSSDCGCVCTCINAGGSNCSATCASSN